MRLIVGLGNPGKDYERTRHNAGFWLVERFAVQSGVVLRKDGKFQALVGRVGSNGAWLVLPQGFMNASGRAVQMLAGFFKIPAAEILVVHDELDFSPGVVKMKQGGGIAGHNGLKDISQRLGTHDYWRLRLGIGHPGDKNAVANYVLQKPLPEERELIDAAIARGIEALPVCLSGDMQGAMQKLHTAEKEKPVEKKPEPKGEVKPEPTPEPAPQKPASKGLFGSLFSTRKK
ncbi:MAG: aminoacyl-tRNA hydrolase [Betaproteobacteria bacterium RBG_16_66_20]|nr:MAG: aminoacyl-tRNA hydrolase [Betaproteobacteria bacterium RBG_16_66_20]